MDETKEEIDPAINQPPGWAVQAARDELDDESPGGTAEWAIIAARAWEIVKAEESSK